MEQTGQDQKGGVWAEGGTTSHSILVCLTALRARPHGLPIETLSGAVQRPFGNG